MIRQIILIGLWLLCSALSACSLDSSQPPASQTSEADELIPTHSIPTARQPTRTAKIDSVSSPTAVLSPAAEPTASQVINNPPQITPTGNDAGCGETNGRLEPGILKSALLGGSIQFQVYLPPCYGENSNQTFPTLYLLHGQGYSERQWEQLGAVETSNKMIASNEVSPYIIVMPREPAGTNSERSNYDLVLALELMPTIDKTYRTRPEREFRAVGGLSRGAGWAIELGITFWDLFGAFGAHSPAVLNTNPISMSNLLDAIPPDKYPRIFIDTGDREPPSIIESAIWLGDLLNQKGIPHEWYRFTGVHDGSYWQEHMERYLRWYTGSW